MLQNDRENKRKLRKERGKFYLLNPTQNSTHWPSYNAKIAIPRAKRAVAERRRGWTPLAELARAVGIAMVRVPLPVAVALMDVGIVLVTMVPGLARSMGPTIVPLLEAWLVGADMMEEAVSVAALEV
jgi:hypothetical protein